MLAKSRPTAVNLFWALERMKGARTQRPRPIAIFAGGPRGEPRDGRARREADPNGRAGHDLLQCRRAGDQRVTAPRSASSGRRSRRTSHLRHRLRDPALPAGRAPDRLGMRAGRHSLHADHRQHGRPPDEPAAKSMPSSSAPTASPPTATPRTRSAPTCWRCWRSATRCPSMLRRRCPPSILKIPTARRSRSKSAPPQEVTGFGGGRWAPEGVQGAQSRVRRDAGGTDHCDRLRGWRGPRSPTASDSPPSCAKAFVFTEHADRLQAVGDPALHQLTSADRFHALGLRRPPWLARRRRSPLPFRAAQRRRRPRRRR